jgi:PHD/YefM family antitoxin component YafN of YafNO toxin-antitoxin module
MDYSLAVVKEKANKVFKINAKDVPSFSFKFEKICQLFENNSKWTKKLRKLADKLADTEVSYEIFIKAGEYSICYDPEKVLDSLKAIYEAAERYPRILPKEYWFETDDSGKRIDLIKGYAKTFLNDFRIEMHAGYNSCYADLAPCLKTSISKKELENIKRTLAEDHFKMLVKRGVKKEKEEVIRIYEKMPFEEIEKLVVFKKAKRINLMSKKEFQFYSDKESLEKGSIPTIAWIRSKSASEDIKTLLRKMIKVCEFAAKHNYYVKSEVTDSERA